MRSKSDASESAYPAERSSFTVSWMPSFRANANETTVTLVGWYSGLLRILL